MVKQAFQKQAQPACNDNTDYMIFLDIDGVLADFDSHLDTQNKRTAKGGPDFDRLDHNWFATIPVFEGAQDFHKEMTKLGEVNFLTAPTMDPGCHSGKAEWLTTKFLPKMDDGKFEKGRGKFALGNLMIVPKRLKMLFAQPNRILVDDTLANVESWIEAGGIGVHHKGDFAETLQAVKDAIKGRDELKLELVPEV